MAWKTSFITMGLLPVAAISLAGCASSQKAKAPPPDPAAKYKAAAMSPHRTLQDLSNCAMYCKEPDRQAAADLFNGWSRLVELEKATAKNDAEEEFFVRETYAAFGMVTRGLLRFMRWAPDTASKVDAAKEVLSFSNAMKPGDPASAEKLLVEVDATAKYLMETDPEAADGHLLQGLVLREQGAIESEVLAAYDKCLDLDPTNSECRELQQQAMATP